ncbi:MAG TPA: sigma-70 family RNA polymerase sigma factor [Acidimicrobiales bacterium]|nr:sigma-70 family RNA polymerase sigma factor [Acidimicrobiales bacterium]
MDDGRDDFEVAFDTLFERSRCLATRMLGDRTLGEDIAAEALARTWLHWSRVHDLEHRRAWVLRVTTNLCLDQLRRRRPAVMALSSPDPTDAVALRLALAAALRKLPRRQREVVVLRHLADLSEAEVARVLGINPGTVGAHLHRGLASLRGRLGDHREELRYALEA